MGAPRRGKRAPEAEQVAVVKVEVPVLVDSTGQAWALPACRELTGAGLAPGSLIESPALDAAAAEVAAQAAREVARDARSRPPRHRPGRHGGSGPRRHPGRRVHRRTPGWLGAGRGAARRRPVAARGCRTPCHPPATRSRHACSQPTHPRARRFSTCVRRRGPGSGSSNAPRWATPSDRASSCASSPTAMTVPPRLARLRHALSDCAVVVANCATNRPALLAAVKPRVAGYVVQVTGAAPRTLFSRLGVAHVDKEPAGAHGAEGPRGDHVHLFRCFLYAFL